MTDAPTARRVAVETADGVTRIALDSPHNRNALSDQLVGELRDALAAAESDPSVRAVVLTHTGGTFCAGADLTEASGRPVGDPARERADQLIDLLHAIMALGKPVVGRIDGHVRAGGMGLVAACDIVVAGPRSPPSSLSRCCPGSRTAPPRSSSSPVTPSPPGAPRRSGSSPAPSTPRTTSTRP